MSYPTPKYKTSTIITNETLLGITDNIEFLNYGVNHDYEQKIAEMNGMPTGGSISVRRQGFRKPQKGLEMTASQIEQEFETITASPNDIVGDLVAVNSSDFILDRNPVTDTEHYQTAKAIALDINKECYSRLKASVDLYVGSDTSTSVSYDTLIDLQGTCSEMRLPTDGMIFLNSKDYGSIQKNIVSTPVSFDESLNQQANQYKVGEYGGFSVMQSNHLLELRHTTAGTASLDNTIEFDALVSTDSFKSATINLKGASTAGTARTLLADDIIEFSVTTRLTPDTKSATTVPLQLVVQPKNDGTLVYTADASGNFANVNVKCGILPLTGTGASVNFANVYEIPAQDEPVTVLKAHKINFYTTKSGFTLANLMLPDLSTLDIKGFGGNKVPSFQSRTLRDGKNELMNANEPFNVCVSYDSDIFKRNQFMRIDTFPVYKVFYGLNVGVITAI